MVVPRCAKAISFSSSFLTVEKNLSSNLFFQKTPLPSLRVLPLPILCPCLPHFVDDMDVTGAQSLTPDGAMAVLGPVPLHGRCGPGLHDSEMHLLPLDPPKKAPCANVGAARGPWLLF